MRLDMGGEGRVSEGGGIVPFCWFIGFTEWSWTFRVLEWEGQWFGLGVSGETRGATCCALLSAVGACDFLGKHVFGATPLDAMI